jgi:hypothetical protein
VLVFGSPPASDVGVDEHGVWWLPLWACVWMNTPSAALSEMLRMHRDLEERVAALEERVSALERRHEEAKMDALHGMRMEHMERVGTRTGAGGAAAAPSVGGWASPSAGLDVFVSWRWSDGVAVGWELGARRLFLWLHDEVTALHAASLERLALPLFDRARALANASAASSSAAARSAAREAGRMAVGEPRALGGEVAVTCRAAPTL